MRLKYYLRGIGIGVIITTLVLMIALTFHKSELLTDAEICDRAAALGMVMPEETVKPVRDTLSNQEKDKASEKNVSAVDLADEKKTDKNSDKKSDEKNIENKTDKKSEDKVQKQINTDADVTEQIELSIVGGEYSDIVSEKLRKAGLIDDPEDFNKFLAKGKYDNLIQPGTYVIPVGADYETIVKIITEKN